MIKEELIMKAKAVRLHSAKIPAGQFHKRIICQKASPRFSDLTGGFVLWIQWNYEEMLLCH